MVECPDRDCREELITMIATESAKHPSTKSVIAIISVPLAVLGIIVTLITLIVNMSIGNIDQKANNSRERNLRQDDRIIALEMRDEKLISDMRLITASLERVTSTLDKLYDMRQ